MALRHRSKKRSWHWMRRELPFWNPPIGTLRMVFDSMAEAHRLSMEEVMRSMCLSASHLEGSNIEPGHGSRLGKSIFTWKPIIVEPKWTTRADLIWFEESSELHFEGMVLPVTDLKYKL